MFNDYDEYDNIDNEVYDVYNLYVNSGTPVETKTPQTNNKPPVDNNIKKPPVPATDKKVNFSDRLEIIPGTQPKYNIFSSCGDNCPKRDAFCANSPSKEKNYHGGSYKKNNMLYDGIQNLSGFEIILIIIVFLFIIYVKQRFDDLEMMMYLIRSGNSPMY